VDEKNLRVISRKEFLSVASVSAAGAVAVACQPKTVIVDKEVPVTQVVKETIKETVIVEGTPNTLPF